MVAHPILIDRRWSRPTRAAPVPPAGSGARNPVIGASAETAHIQAMSRLDPRLLLQGYAAGIFPMADSREPPSCSGSSRVPGDHATR